jgi:hypothetical protein
MRPYYHAATCHWVPMLHETHIKRIHMKLRTAVVAGFALLLTSCASMPRYTAAEPRLAVQKPEISNSSVVVLFQPVFPGKPLSETIVDNAIGAMWNPAEASQIGFTQRYAETLANSGPQLAMIMAMPANVRPGFAASGQAGGFNISSRLMVPIGRFITENTNQLLQAGTPKFLVCSDVACMEQAHQSGNFDRYVTIRIRKLRVAEEKVNHLTLEAEAEAEVEVADARKTIGTRSIRAFVQDRSITSEGFFHSDFLRVMNKIANEVSSNFAEQVLAAAKS